MTPRSLTETSASTPQVDSLLDPPRTVDLEEAVRERVRLHPQAHVQEIVAMLELAGHQASFEFVQQMVDQMRPASCFDGNSPPAPRLPR